MAFGSRGGPSGSTPMAEINIIPLVDVMLVLLVIFMVTAPLLTHAVRVELPKAASTAQPAEPQAIDLAVNAAGEWFWNAEAVSRRQLSERLRDAGQQQPVPEIHLRADRDTRYEVLAQTMSEASRFGVNRVGLMTDPSVVLDRPDFCRQSVAALRVAPFKLYR